jgi:hypothetical protein
VDPEKKLILGYFCPALNKSKTLDFAWTVVGGTRQVSKASRRSIIDSRAVLTPQPRLDMSSAHETEEEDAAAEENEGEESGEVADNDNNSAAEGDGEHYVVERIMEEMLAEDGIVWYLIRWEGYEPEGDTWEPYEHIKQCTDIIANWEATKAARAKQKGI